MISNSNSSSRRGFGLVFALLLLLPGVSAISLAAEKIVSVTVSCPDPQVKEQAGTFFESVLRGEYDVDKAHDAIRKFYSEWPVYSIDLLGEPADGGWALTVDVDVRPVLTDVSVQGSQQLKKAEIRAQVDLNRGDRAVPTALQRARQRLTEYYFYRGFPNAGVNLEVEQESDLREANLAVSIREGTPCRIEGVEISSSSTALTSERARKLLRVAEGDRCDGLKVSEGAERIRQALRDEERLAVQVSDPELTYNADRSAARVTVRVTPGPRIRVRFEGNTFAFERDTQLTKAIFLDEERQFNTGWIDSAATEGIRQFYASYGYSNAQVKVSDTYDENADLRSIRFDVNRGARMRIRKVTFDGNGKIAAEDLEDQFWGLAPPATRDRIFVREELTPLSEGLLAFYQQHGFLRAKVSAPAIAFRTKENVADISFKINEGSPSFLKEYRSSGNQTIASKQIAELFSVSPGDSIDPVAMRQGADRVEERYRRLGYKFVKVRLPAPEDVPAGRNDYEIPVEEGPRVMIGDIRVRGNLHTQEYVVRRELTFEKGEVYDPEKLKESRRHLLRLGFFESVTLDELPFDPETGTEGVIVSVTERRKRSVALRPGFSTDEGYRGAVEFGYVNIGGTGRSATVSGSVSRQFRNPQIIEHRAAFTYLEPHLFGIADGKVNFIDERREELQFDIDRRSVILGVERNIWKWLRATLQWELEYRDPFNVQAGVILSPIDQDRARFGSIATILDFDFRNDPLNPTVGSFHRLHASAFNSTFLSDAAFAQVYVRNSFYIPFYRRFRSVLSVRAGFSGTYGETKQAGISEIPIEKRFRLGGNDSLRGFGRNCVGGLGSNVAESCGDTVLTQAPGGNAVFNYMWDFLAPLFGGFDLALFTDGGNAYLQNGEFNPFEIRTTAGAGLRYNTFFGPLRLDLGFKLDRRPGERLWEIHFAVGQF
ncbi:MAG: POTRA domain-containing protein [Pseudomonadota bacterium]